MWTHRWGQVSVVGDDNELEVVRVILEVEMGPGIDFRFLCLELAISGGRRSQKNGQAHDEMSHGFLSRAGNWRLEFFRFKSGLSITVY
jgi:hypothetical protein